MQQTKGDKDNNDLKDEAQSTDKDAVNDDNNNNQSKPEVKRPHETSQDELPYRDKDVFICYAYREDSDFDCYCKEEFDQLIELKTKHGINRDSDHKDYLLPECIRVEVLSKQAVRDLEEEEEREAKKKKQKTDSEEEEDNEDDDDEFEDESFSEDEELNLPFDTESWGILELSTENKNKNDKYHRVLCHEFDPFRGSVFSGVYQWKWISKASKVSEKQENQLQDIISDFF